MSYRILDEPGPTALARVTVNPIWPLLASMFAGTWLAWPWFALNSLSLGVSRRLYVDLLLIAAGFVATLLSIVALDQLLASGILDERNYRYAWLVPQAVRLILLYAIFMRQERTFQLFEYFGGKPANGMLPLMVGALGRGAVLSSLPKGWILFFV